MPGGRAGGRGKDMATEDLEEIKRSLNFMSGELSKVTSQQDRLLRLMEEVKELKILLTEKDKKISALEQRVDELEQYTRREDLVIMGLETRHRSYAKAVANHDSAEDASDKELETLEQQVVTFLHSKNITIQRDAISICHALPKKFEKAKPTIVVRFTSRKQRNSVLLQANKLRGTNVYINEHLTKKNGTIAREARMLKKQKKIVATWTRNGSVWIREQEGSQAKIIKELGELEKFNKQ
uniref:Uncharacterized protein n=1 Tax=Nothobranchius rachovii TaxID=451742 RepID=A0A1A8PAD9_9TELE